MQRYSPISSRLEYENKSVYIYKFRIKLTEINFKSTRTYQLILITFSIHNLKKIHIFLNEFSKQTSEYKLIFLLIWRFQTIFSGRRDRYYI